MILPLPGLCAVSVPVLLTRPALSLTRRHEWLRAHLLGLAGRDLVVRRRHGQHGLGHTVGRDNAPCASGARRDEPGAAVEAVGAAAVDEQVVVRARPVEDGAAGHGHQTWR